MDRMRFSLRALMIAIVVAAAVVAGGRLAWRAATFPPQGDTAILTHAKLGRLLRDDPRCLTLELDDVHGLWGGTSVRVAGDGSVIAIVVRPAQPGELGFQQSRREGHIDAARRRRLFETVLDEGTLDVRRRRDVGVPDEGTPRITLIATIHGRAYSRWVWLFDGEARETPAFDRVRRALLDLTAETDR